MVIYFAGRVFGNGPLPGLPHFTDVDFHQSPKGSTSRHHG